MYEIDSFNYLSGFFYDFNRKEFIKSSPWPSKKAYTAVNHNAEQLLCVKHSWAPSGEGKA